MSFLKKAKQIFKRNYIMIANTILRIPGWMVIVSVLIPVYFMYSRGISVSIDNNVWENIFCDAFLLNLWIPMSVMVLLAGIGVAKEDDAIRYMRMGKRFTVAKTNLISAFIVIVAFSFAVLMIYILYFRLHSGMDLANQWSSSVLATADLEEGFGNLYPSPIVVRTFSPMGAMLMMMLFLIIYCFFLTIISMTINAVLKQSIGSIFCGFFIIIVSLLGNRTFGEYSLYPFYNGQFKSLTEVNNFVFLNYSIIYWIIVLSIVISIYCFVMRKVDLISLSREK